MPSRMGAGQAEASSHDLRRLVMGAVTGDGPAAELEADPVAERGGGGGPTREVVLGIGKGLPGESVLGRGHKY